MLPRRTGDRAGSPPPLIDEELADQLLGKAQAEGVELLGPDGLLSQVTKAVLERALRTDFSDDAAWDAVCAARPAATPEGFMAGLSFVSDRPSPT